VGRVDNYLNELSNKFQTKGSWCTPECKDTLFSGNLSFVPNYGATLDVKDHNQLWDYVQQHRILWGTTEESQKITVFGFPAQQHSLLGAPVDLRRKDVRIGGNSQSTYHFREVFVGEHFENIECVRLKTLSIDYPFLNGWISAERGEPFEGQTELIEPQPKMRSRQAVSDIESVEVKNDSIIVTAKPQGVPLEIYRDIVFHMQNFFTLMTLDPLYASSVTGTLLKTNKSVEIFYPQQRVSQPLYGRISAPYVLLTYGEIKNEFDHLVKNMFNLDRVVCELFFNNFYSPFTYIEARFLNLVEALEALHRKTRDGEYMTKEEYRERFYGHLKNKINEIPKIQETPDFRESLVSRLRFAYEWALRKRLERFFKEELGERFLDIFVYQKRDKTKEQQSTRKDKFIKDIVDTRNYYIHFDKDPDANVLEGRELWQATQKLEIFFSIVLLSELGVQPNIRDLAVEFQSQNGFRFSHLRV
jgi:hypothetical protein